ncbi:MAG: MFS transporter [Dehalococcoidia bacterium]|nr:MFS transporter [Dehalococcoidia bacterium]MCB9486680.1 MFS transporter [Thermoflexaceae bacterium]
MNKLPAFKYRDFRYLWVASTCAQIALWTLLLGNAQAVYQISDKSSAWVGVSTFASMSPFLIAPIGGVISDRFERRAVALVSRSATLVVVAVLLFLALAGLMEVWMVISLALLQGLVRSVQMPADQALIANVVPATERGNAIALQSMTQHGTRAVGPLIVLLLSPGYEGAYAVGAVFSVISVVAILPMQLRSRGGVTRMGAFVKNISEGISYVKATPPVLAVFVLVFAHCALTMSFDSMLPGFAEDNLHSETHGFLIMSIGVGIGALVGTFMLAIFSDTSRGVLFLGSAVLSGLSPILMATATSVPMAANAAVLMGMSQGMMMALASIIIQDVVPDEVRGRVMSLNAMSAGGIMAMANLGFGALADRIGAPTLFLIPALAFLAIVALTLLIGGHYRRIYRTGHARIAPAAA